MERQNQEAFTERAAKALEGIEMLLAMWIEKSVPAAELWVGEEPDAELARKAWRPKDGAASSAFESGEEPSAPEVTRRLQHIEERLSRFATDLKALEARVHEEQPE